MNEKQTPLDQELQDGRHHQVNQPETGQASPAGLPDVYYQGPSQANQANHDSQPEQAGEADRQLPPVAQEHTTTPVAEVSQSRGSRLRRVRTALAAAALTSAALFGLGTATGADHEEGEKRTTGISQHMSPQERQMLADISAAEEAEQADRTTLNQAAAVAANSIINNLSRPESGAEFYVPGHGSQDGRQTYWGNKRNLIGDDLIVGTEDDRTHGPEFFVGVDPDTGIFSAGAAHESGEWFNSLGVVAQLKSDSPVWTAAREGNLTVEDYRTVVKELDAGHAELLSLDAADQDGQRFQGNNLQLGIELQSRDQSAVTAEQAASLVQRAADNLGQTPLGPNSQ